MSDTFEATTAAFIADTDYDDVPGDAVDTIRRAFIDTVAVTLAGTTADGGQIMQAFVERDTAHQSDVDTDAVTQTALRLGNAAHALDYDDMAWAMDGHPSVVLVPPILALTHTCEVTGEDAVTAYAVGFEVACAVADPISPTHYERGWHATATFGTFGATAAAASVLDLSTTECKQALAMAASMGAGTKRNFGSMTKPLHTGLAARAGVTAAQLAAEGFTAGDAAISGERGFWDLYGDRPADGPQLPREEWYLTESGIHTKRYPCCYFTHSAIAAVQELCDMHDVTATDVETVRVQAAGGAGDALTYARPETPLEAKFSMPHAVAVALTHDHVGLSAFQPDTVTDSAVRNLYDRVTFSVDESLPYDSQAATVEIDTGEETLTVHREQPPWVHTQPPSQAELRMKFDECAATGGYEEVADDIFTKVERLPAGDLSGLLTYF